MDIIALITVPITVFSLIQGEPLIRLLFQNRSFDENSVRLTHAAFKFHMPGLFFIALNRIMAPAFYAQSDSRSPTLAGIISFAVNIILAAAMVRPMKGAGIALALTLASGVNTALLLAFLKRNPEIAVARALRSALIYTAKLALFSAAAALPVLALKPRIAALFAGRGRLIGYGLPLIITALIYGAAGLLLLAITGDSRFRAAAGMMRKRKRPSAP
jgi:putative peptidoglycan lipid II flippase